VWYINPAYFVDVVRYRIHLVRAFLERLKAFDGNEASFRCVNTYCRYECTLREANERLMAAHLQRMVSGGSGGSGGGGLDASLRGAVVMGGVVGAAASAGGAAGGGGGGASASTFTCPLCGGKLAARHVERLTATATRLLLRFNDQLRVTGIPTILARLEGEKLAEGMPTTLLREGKMSLLKEDFEPATPAGISLAERATLDARAKMAQSRNLTNKIYMPTAASAYEQEEADRAAAAAAIEARKSKGAVAPATVSEAALPEHLKHSSVTGEAAKVLGFVRLTAGSSTSNGGGGGDGDDDDGAGDDGAAGVGLRVAGDGSAAGAAGANVAFDTDINADAGGGGGGGAGLEGMDEAALWQALFLAASAGGGGEADAAAPAPPAAVAAGGSGGGGGEEEEEWEDV